MLMVVVWAASTAYFVRIGVDLHRNGSDAADVVFCVGLMALLNVAVCVIAIALHRRIKAVWAVRRGVGRDRR
jgi:hypothetical protein